MTLEDQLEEIIKRVIREELARARESQDLALLTAEQVAELLNFTDTHSVYRLKREGKLRAVNLGAATMRFTRAEVRRFIESQAA